MHKDSVLYLTFVLACIGGALYYLGNIFYLAWYYWWFDMIMHFLVPFTGGLGIFWGLFDSGIIFRDRFQSRVAMIVPTFICALLVVIGWEIWEYANGLTDSTEGYVLDTINDLILGSIGVLLACLIATKRKNHG